MVDIPEGTVTATAKLVGHGSSLKIEYAFFNDMSMPIKKLEESFYPATDWESDPLNLMPYLNSITIDAWKIEGWRDEAASNQSAEFWRTENIANIGMKNNVTTAS